MKTLSLVLATVLGLTLAGAGYARQPSVTDPGLPRTLPSDSSPVSVSWTDPAQFTELRFSGNRWEAQRGTWVSDLARYLQTQAARKLAPGQTMQVTITDIARAGRYEPTASIRMNDIRIVKDIYPPRMTLNFKVLDANGEVVSEGERKLVDHSFLLNAGITNNDLLRYEKRMIDDWLRNEFKPGV
jgi:hypothetical protein